MLFLFLFTSCKKSMDSKPSTVPVNLDTLPAPNGLTVSLQVNQSTPGYLIPETFEGLSYETGILANSSGFLNEGNTVLVRLIKNLGGGILRVGGNSSDKTYWTGKPRLKTTGSDSLTTTDIDNLSSFSSAIGWKVLFGLNLGDYNPDLAADEAQYLNSSLKTNLWALQNGNEPDIYTSNGLRTKTYSTANYLMEWNSYYQAVKNLVPNLVFAGPDVAYNQTWINSFSPVENMNVVMMDGHYYRTGPSTDTNIHYQTILAPDSKFTAYLQTLYNASSKYNLPFRLSECNSVYNGGKTGVSDVFASSLWALDFMWQVAENKGSGVNFHGGSGGPYSPFISTNGITSPRPIYYSMLAFNYGGTGGNIIPATLSANPYNCTAYACIKNGITYLTLINKEPLKNLSFSIQLTHSSSSVQIQSLVAPSITANSGISFAGNTVNADGTYSLANPKSYRLNGKNLNVNIPAGSAAVIIIQ
jgi:hypothetical protein